MYDLLYSRATIAMLGDGSVYGLFVVLQVDLMLKRHLTEFVFKPFSFDMRQVLLLKVLCQVSRTCKFMYALPEREPSLPQTDEVR